jgi:hypothetical protein
MAAAARAMGSRRSKVSGASRIETEPSAASNPEQPEEAKTNSAASKNVWDLSVANQKPDM